VAYSYPAPRTGTAQDLFRVVTRAYELELERTGVHLPEKSELSRRWIGAAARGAGACIGALLEFVPADWTVAFHDRLFAALSAPYSYSFLSDAPSVQRAKALTADIKARTGRDPALLAMISHPPVMGRLAHLNLELVRHATLALRSVRGRPCRPRMVTAIDPFALDTLSVYEEGLYSGFMGSFHVGVDRLALRIDGGLGFIRRSRWFTMPARLLHALGEGGEIGLVPSGGVPSTGRVLYGVRDWARRIRRLSPLNGHPVQAEARLRSDASYRRFLDGPAKTLLPARRVWNGLDAWLMAVGAGLMPGETIEAAGASALASLEVPEDRRAELLADLKRDFRRETPSRRRLFRLLASRVLRRRPIVFLPIVHSVEPLGIRVLDARSWERSSSGALSVRRAETPEVATDTTAEKFAVEFIEENFA
jgi:hypothetical protein